MTTQKNTRHRGATRKAATQGRAVATTIIPIMFTVEGVPRPKARARRGAGGRWYTPQVTRDYEHTVSVAAKAAGLSEPLTGAVRLSIGLWLPDRRRRDLDNCAKSICDGLNGIVYQDDSQIAELIVRRFVDRQRPRAEITFEAIPRPPESRADGVERRPLAGMRATGARQCSKTTEPRPNSPTGEQGLSAKRSLPKEDPDAR